MADIIRYSLRFHIKLMIKTSLVAQNLFHDNLPILESGRVRFGVRIQVQVRAGYV